MSYAVCALINDQFDFFQSIGRNPSLLVYLPVWKDDASYHQTVASTTADKSVSIVISHTYAMFTHYTFASLIKLSSVSITSPLLSVHHVGE